MPPDTMYLTIIPTVYPNEVSLRMRTLEDDLWLYFGYPNEHWRNRCAVCRGKVGELRSPVPECIDCWKVEVWSRSPWLVECVGEAEDAPDRLTRLAFELATRFGGGFVAKMSKYPIQVVRTGEPSDQYPQSETDNLLMIYATSVGERDKIRRAVCEVLGLDLSTAENIPVRRGCWLYDPILGPWQTWKLH